MSIEVQIPLCLAIDPALKRRGIGAEVGQSVSDAVTRALAEMDRELIAPRGGYAWPELNAPTFVWNASSADVDRDWRLEIERHVTAGLRDAAAGAPNTAAMRLENAPEVIPRAPSEPFDPSRRHGDGYHVQSYEGDVPSPDIPVTLERYRTTPEWQRGHMVNLWSWFGSDAGLIQNIRTFLAQFPTGFVSTGTLGVMYVGSGLDGQAMRIAVVSVGGVSEGSVSASLVRSFPIGASFEQFSVDLNNDDEDSRRVSEQAVNEASIQKGRAVQGVADARAAFVEDALTRIGVPTIEGMTREQVLQVLRDVATRRAANFNPIYPDGFFARFVVGSGTGGYACTIPRQSFSGAALRVLPVYHVVERPADGEKSEGGAGTGGTGRRGSGEGGGGDSNGGRGGGGTGEGEGEGTARRRGSPLADPAAVLGEGPTRFYPSNPGGEPVEIDLGPFAGEPNLDELGDLGNALRRLMRRIAFRLEMPMGDYAGSFCIGAAQMIGIRAGGIAAFSETTTRATRTVEAGTGNLGDVDMSASHTPAITMIRYIAGTVPTLTRLQHLMIEIYNIPHVAALITGWREGNPAGWGLDFYKSYTPKIKESVGSLFIDSCQIKMLELLRNSEREIDARLTNFSTYYPMVRSMLLGLVASEARLEELRRTLVSAKAAHGDVGASLQESYQNWRQARHALTTTLSGQLLNASSLSNALSGQGGGTDGEIIDTPQGLRVRDADGRSWSEDELNQAIAFRHGTAASIDPLIHQFRDIPEVVQAFEQSPALSRLYLHSLLREMKRNNREIRTQVVAEKMFAFRAGKIREDLPNRTIPYTDLSLQGIHLVVHEAIGDAFEGARAYALGVQYVMDVEQGRRGLIAFAETVSVIALAVVCPPAAAALGAIYAGMHYAEASEIEQLYGSLIDPELILNRAEVEFDLFLAEFEIALSIIPEAGALVRGGTTAVRTVGRRGARAGLQSLGQQARRQILASVSRQVKSGIARHIVREVLTERGIALILPHVLGPVFMQIHREISVLSGRPVPPEAAGTPPVPEHLTENENELIRRLEEYQEGDRDENLPGAEEAP